MRKPYVYHDKLWQNKPFINVNSQIGKTEELVGIWAKFGSTENVHPGINQA